MDILPAFILLAICVVIHTSGLAVIYRSLHQVLDHGRSPLQGIWQLIHVAWALVLLHIIEICVWGVFYWWEGCFPDARTAFYFSGVTYTTLGYGDVVLPVGWRMLGPTEGLTGILMCGLSTAFFFAVMLRVVRSADTSGKD